MNPPNLPAAGRTSTKEERTLRPAMVVPPAQYDRMHGPAWTQVHSAPARAGALDHQRIASRGYRC